MDRKVLGHGCTRLFVQGQGSGRDHGIGRDLEQVEVQDPPLQVTGDIADLQGGTDPVVVIFVTHL